MSCANPRRVGLLRRMTVYHIESDKFGCDHPVMYLGFLDDKQAKALGAGSGRRWVLAGWQFLQLGTPVEGIPIVVHDTTPTNKDQRYLRLISNMHYPEE